MTKPFRISPFWCSVLILLLTLIAYAPALNCGFIWDDDDYVINNLTLRDLDGLRRMWFQLGAVPQYYPLVHTTFWAEYQLWNLNPFGYHLVNVLLHAAAAVLFGRVLMRLQLPGAWLAAALFALHPVMVESVAWITERKNVLSAVFYFGSALLYLRFMETRDAAGGRRAWGLYLAAFALFIAALLSKTVTCSLPAALLLIHWWKSGRVPGREIVPLLPFFAAGVALGLLTVWVERHFVGAQGSEFALSWLDRCLIAGRALWFYAGKLLLPFPLTFIYPRWQIDPSQWWQWLFPLGAAAVAAALWVARNRIGRGPLAAVLFFAGSLSPALGFINVYPMRYSFVADHFQYIASAGLIALAAAGLARIRAPQWAPLLLLPLFGWLTWQQTHIYRDKETLWRDTLAKNPSCWLAHNNLGVELQARGKLDEARQHYEAALAAEPEFPETYKNMGNFFLEKGDSTEAARWYEKALAIKPDFPDALNSFGVTLALKGNYPEAISHFRKALELKPGFARAHLNLGNALRMQKDFDGAIAHYHTALANAADPAPVHLNLAQTLEEKGDLNQALIHYRLALRFDSKNPESHFGLARVLAESGQTAAAQNQVREVLRLKPDHEGARSLLELLQSSAP